MRCRGRRELVDREGGAAHLHLRQREADPREVLGVLRGRLALHHLQRPAVRRAVPDDPLRDQRHRSEARSGRLSLRLSTRTAICARRSTSSAPRTRGSSSSTSIWPAKSFGVETSKGEGLDGRSVETWYRAGRHREIADYCLDDVRATAELYEKVAPTLLMFNKEFREAEERAARMRRQSELPLAPSNESLFIESVTKTLDRAFRVARRAGAGAGGHGHASGGRAGKARAAGRGRGRDSVGRVSACVECARETVSRPDLFADCRSIRGRSGEVVCRTTTTAIWPSTAIASPASARGATCRGRARR